jgi:hypothetical protein
MVARGSMARAKSVTLCWSREGAAWFARLVLPGAFQAHIFANGTAIARKSLSLIAIR